MPGNSHGKLFKVTTYGESHGEAIGCIIDGCPPNLKIDIEYIQKDLDRRKPGKTRHTSQRRESDTVKILSGVFEGRSTGTPISLIIYNEDARSKDTLTLKICIDQDMLILLMIKNTGQEIIRVGEGRLPEKQRQELLLEQ